VTRKPSRRFAYKNASHNPVTILVPLVVALVAAGCVPASAGSDSAEVYVVQAGDTLAGIATANDTTVDKLVELNADTYPSLETDPGAIEVGWELELPDDGGSGISIPVTITTKKTPSAGTDSTATPLDQDAFEAEIVRLVNQERSKAGLAPLEVDQRLMKFARERSEDMVARNYLGHNDPQTGESLFAPPLRAQGWSGHLAENATKLLRTTSMTRANANRAVANWIKSEGHRKNIMKDHVHYCGVGIAIGSNYILVTQLFAE
jgi:uncharacterized protein YkwD